MKSRKQAKSTDDIAGYFASIAPYWVAGAVASEFISPEYRQRIACVAMQSGLREGLKESGKQLLRTSLGATSVLFLGYSAVNGLSLFSQAVNADQPSPTPSAGSTPAKSPSKR